MCVRSIDYLPAVGSPTDVRGNERRVAPGSLNFPDHRFHLRFGPRGDEHPRTFSGEPQGDCPPDPPASSSHNGHPILQ